MYSELKQYILDNLVEDFTAAAEDSYSEYLTVYYFMSCKSLNYLGVSV